MFRGQVTGKKIYHSSAWEVCEIALQEGDRLHKRHPVAALAQAIADLGLGSSTWSLGIQPFAFPIHPALQPGVVKRSRASAEKSGALGSRLASATNSTVWSKPGPSPLRASAFLRVYSVEQYSREIGTSVLPRAPESPLPPSVSQTLLQTLDQTAPRAPRQLQDATVHPVITSRSTPRNCSSILLTQPETLSRSWCPSNDPAPMCSPGQALSLHLPVFTSSPSTTLHFHSIAPLQSTLRAARVGF